MYTVGCASVVWCEELWLGFQDVRLCTQAMFGVQLLARYAAAGRDSGRPGRVVDQKW
jgi:hypothetical protein